MASDINPISGASPSSYTSQETVTEASAEDVTAFNSAMSEEEKAKVVKENFTNMVFQQMRDSMKEAAKKYVEALEEQKSANEG